jgi:hypothetical protein
MEPILKTDTALIEYLNRLGFVDEDGQIKDDLPPGDQEEIDDLVKINGYLRGAPAVQERQLREMYEQIVSDRLLEQV